MFIPPYLLNHLVLTQSVVIKVVDIAQLYIFDYYGLCQNKVVKEIWRDEHLASVVCLRWY